jgi:hypothetical protein
VNTYSLFLKKSLLMSFISDITKNIGGMAASAMGGGNNMMGTIMELVTKFQKDPNLLNNLKDPNVLSGLTNSIKEHIPADQVSNVIDMIDKVPGVPNELKSPIKSVLESLKPKSESNDVEIEAPEALEEAPAIETEEAPLETESVMPEMETPEIMPEMDMPEVPEVDMPDMPEMPSAEAPTQM